MPAAESAAQCAVAAPMVAMRVEGPIQLRHEAERLRRDHLVSVGRIRYSRQDRLARVVED